MGIEPTLFRNSTLNCCLDKIRQVDDRASCEIYLKQIFLLILAVTRSNDAKDQAVPSPGGHKLGLLVTVTVSSKARLQHLIFYSVSERWHSWWE